MRFRAGHRALGYKGGSGAARLRNGRRGLRGKTRGKSLRAPDRHRRATVRSVEGGALLNAPAKDQAEARAEPAIRSVSNAAISRGHCTGVRWRAPGITVSLEFGMASCKLRDMATGVA